MPSAAQTEGLLRKRAVMNAIDAADKGRGRVGSRQRRLIACLCDHGHYSPGGGWVWGTDAETRQILDSLVHRGLVKLEWPPAYAGRFAHLGLSRGPRPRYTLCDELQAVLYDDNAWRTAQPDTPITKEVAAS